jgi:hypothetical protein
MFCYNEFIQITGNVKGRAHMGDVSANGKVCVCVMSKGVGWIGLDLDRF